MSSSCGFHYRILHDYTVNTYGIQRGFFWSWRAACAEGLGFWRPHNPHDLFWASGLYDFALWSLWQKEATFKGWYHFWSHHIPDMDARYTSFESNWMPGLGRHVTFQSDIHTLEYISSYSVSNGIGRAQRASVVQWKWHGQECKQPYTSSILTSHEKVSALPLGKASSPHSQEVPLNARAPFTDGLAKLKPNSFRFGLLQLFRLTISYAENGYDLCSVCRIQGSSYSAGPYSLWRILLHVYCLWACCQWCICLVCHLKNYQLAD